MANLKNFFNPALTTGTEVDLYFNGRSHIHIGEGKVHNLDVLNAKFWAKGKVLHIDFNETVEIVMPDETPSGTCRIRVGNGEWIESKYSSSGSKLNIEFRKIEIYVSSRHWTILGIQTDTVYAWVGIWPKGKAVAEADFEVLAAL
jgi:hypothetical protein